MYPIMYPSQTAAQYAYDNQEGGTYGGTAASHLQKPSRLHIKGMRFSLNTHAMALSLFAPWILFTVILATLSFSMHYQYPSATFAVVSLGLLPAVICGILLVLSRTKLHHYAGAEREPSWMVFILITLATAWFAAVTLGERNFIQNTKAFYDMQNLGTYTDIYPNRMRGQQIMDAGIIDFIPGSKIDVSRSIGFKNSEIYCAAPISFGNDTLSTYDFWAVGKNCCSGFQADFHCAGFNDPRARGGIRLVREEDKAFYRLAVQQAEATHHIRAVHPLFFHWVQDPEAVHQSWLEDGWRFFYMATCISFVVQGFVVAAAAVAFTRLGK